MLRLVVFCALLGITYATYGFDAISPLPISKIQCMKNRGHLFYIGRVYRSNGAIDYTGLQNMKNAWAGGMSYVDAYIFPCNSCRNPAGQVLSTVNALRNSGVRFGMIWLDVEIYNWPSDKAANRQFLLRMAEKLNALGINWGVYISAHNWQSIVGADWTGLSYRPLWWATYNGQANFKNFRAFGGWSKPAIHQYAGDVRSPCGFETDYNWYP